MITPDEDMIRFMTLVNDLVGDAPFVVVGFNNDGPDGSLQAVLGPNPDYSPK